MTNPLDGRLALVTGATRGLGQAIALRLLGDGARVIGTGTKPRGTAPAGCEYRAVDFSDAGATAAFAEEAGGTGIDILVNNAGTTKISDFAEIAPDDFTRIQQVNVMAPFMLSRAVVPGMKERGWGRIVNIASLFSVISKEGRASYSASKAALDGMTAALSAEVAQFGILANCVSPGFIETDMTRNSLGRAGMDELATQVPARRLGTPQEIAALVAWLAGPENTYISGQNIAIDGGFTRV